MDDDGWDDTDDPSDDNEQLAALAIVSRLCDNQCIPLLEKQISNLCRLLRDHDMLPLPECCNVPQSGLLAEIDSFYFDLTQDWLSEIHLYFEINA